MNMELPAAEGRTGSENNAGRFPSRYARFGAFQLDLKRQDLTKNGTRLRLPAKVGQVLIALLERHGDIVTRGDLRARLWASNTHVNFDANVNTTVNKLRQILGDSNEQSIYVQTIPRKGYSFIGTLEFTDRPEIAAVSEEVTAGENGPQPDTPSRSKLFTPQQATVWFTAGVIALVIAAMLLGAAITLYSHRTF